MDHQATSVAETSLEITIIRADGRVEHLGVVSYWSRNPLKRARWRLQQLARRLRPLQP